MFFKEDTTYNDVRERSVRQWLSEMSEHSDIAVRGGTKVTGEYIDELQRQIRMLNEKCELREQYLRKMKEKTRQ